MVLFFVWYIELMKKCFDAMNGIAFQYTYDGISYTVPYGWICVGFIVFGVIASVLWRGARK